jgi:benzoyl-CoA reductase/2-hydroxyglutaryl-CoA dehydratase subunit BcrC/BadD/HgdB
MAPSGYWTKEKVRDVTKTWNKPIEESINETHLTEILPAEYKAFDISDVVAKQTHLSPTEQDQLKHVLLDFEDLFKGQCGKYNGDPVSLEFQRHTSKSRKTKSTD